MTRVFSINFVATWQIIFDRDTFRIAKSIQHTFSAVVCACGWEGEEGKKEGEGMGEGEGKKEGEEMQGLWVPPLIRYLVVRRHPDSGMILQSNPTFII